jgi:hypothetical protein
MFFPCSKGKLIIVNVEDYGIVIMTVLCYYNVQITGPSSLPPERFLIAEPVATSAESAPALRRPHRGGMVGR